MEYLQIADWIMGVSCSRELLGQTANFRPFLLENGGGDRKPDCAVMLGEAVDQVGGPQVRNTATIGGNICNGATSADSASTMCALNAIVVLQGPEGIREVPVTEFYKKTDSPDGLQTWCKECFKKATKKTRIGGGVSEELKMYTSRQLMEELAKRGYRGELEYVKKVNLNNL